MTDERCSMKVKKIKISGIMIKLGYTVACCALGWYLHGRFAPQNAGGYNMGTPHVLVSELAKGDISARKKYIAEAQAINAVDIIPQVSGYLEEILFKDNYIYNFVCNCFSNLFGYDFFKQARASVIFAR